MFPVHHGFLRRNTTPVSITTFSGSFKLFLETCSSLHGTTNMSSIDYQAFHFLNLSQQLQKKACGLETRTAFLRFKALFGVVPLVCEQIWKKIKHDVPQKGKPVHLLFALLKLKTYANDSICATICSCDEKTFRKWCWPFVFVISRLQNV